MVTITRPAIPGAKRCDAPTAVLPFDKIDLPRVAFILDAGVQQERDRGTSSDQWLRGFSQVASGVALTLQIIARRAVTYAIRLLRQIRGGGVHRPTEQVVDKLLSGGYT